MNMKKFLAAALLTCSGVSANAASVSLVYSGDNDVDAAGVVIAAAGDTLTFDLVIDFSDRPTLGGGFDINWDSDVFEYQGFYLAGFDIAGRDPVLEDGRLFNASVGNFNGLTTGTIAFMSFLYIGGSGSITPSGTTGTGGPWIDAITFVDIIEPEYFGVQVGFVPVPAAVWLLLSGLGALIGFGRR